MRNKLLPAVTITASLSLPNAALAHHVMGGGVPDTFTAGLLSGFGHPVIGVDHLAFIVAMGLAAAFMAQRALAPLAFILATVAGCLLQVAGIALPLAEIVIAGSVVVLGALVLSGRLVPAAGYLALFSVAGLFHGWAYGQSIVGAETTPLAAYLVGFAAVQYAIAFAAGWITTSVWRAAGPAAIKPRLAGAVAAGFGAAFLIENIEGMLFA